MASTISVGRGTDVRNDAGLFARNAAFSGYSVRDLDAAHAFYGGKLGLDVTLEEGFLSLRFPGGQRLMIYAKDDHQPATYTVLNIEVEDIESAVDQLAQASIQLERYGPELEQDERGISRMADGPLMAWFEDPSGNIISVIQADGDKER